MSFELLGVKVDNFSEEEIFEKIKGFLNSDKFSHVVTMNPEFIVDAQKDIDFKSAINSADLRVTDGIGIKFALWYFGKKLKKRLAGVDLMWNLLKIAEQKNMKVFLVANERGISSWQDTAEAIRRYYPRIMIGGINMDYSVCYLESEVKENMRNLNGYDILFCNFGAPDQEKFIADLKKYNRHIKLAMGVGGSFDFISGKVLRAPKWMRRIGIEWFWRLMMNPKRISRVIKAVIIFPVKIILNK